MKKYLLAVLCFVVAEMLTACGKEIPITIKDGTAKTMIEAKTGQTVEMVLEDAEIVVGEKDKIFPALETKLTEDDEIVIARYAKVTVVYDDNENIVEMHGGTVENAIKAANITLDTLDYVDVNLEQEVTDGMVVNITSHAEVSIKADGETKSLVTAAKTVQDLLDEQGILVDEDDIISCEPESGIINGMELVIKRVEVKKETEKKVIKFKTKTQNSSKIVKGKTQVIQDGSNGEKKIVYKITYVDGVEQDREVIKEKITKKPIDKIILSGTRAVVTVVKTEYFDDCDGSGHGYKIVYYSNGSKKKVEY